MSRSSPSWLQPSPTSDANDPVSSVRQRAWLQPSATSQPSNSVPSGRQPAWSHPPPTSQVISSVPSGRQPAWLQPAPTSQVSSSVSSGRQPAHQRTPAWLQPAATSSGTVRPGRPALAERTWLRPSAVSIPPAKRTRLGHVSSEADDHRNTRHIHLDLATVLMATDVTDNLTKFAEHGMDRGRVEKVLQQPCRCSPTARCQAKTLPLSSLMAFLDRWHHLSEECKSHLLATSYDSCGSHEEDHKALRTCWHLLGVPVCVDALATLLATSKRTLYKEVHGIGDGRKGAWSVHPVDRPQAKVVDQFFAELYMSAAEHLAEQDLRVDKIDDAIAHDAAVVDGSPVSNAPEPLCDVSWNPDRSFSTEAFMAAGDDLSSFPKRFCSMGVCLICGGSSWPGGPPQ